MIEASMAVIVIAFGYFYYRSADRESKLSHIHWVIIAIRTRRDWLQKAGKNEEAEHLTTLADEVSQLAGRISHKITSDSDARLRASQAINRVSADDFLSKLGLVSGSAAFLPTKNALYWLAKEVR